MNINTNNPTENEYPKLSRNELCTLTLLCVVNVFNYMDRIGVAGLLVPLQDDFDIGDDLAGLLQSSLVLAYLIAAPIFGYFGDRYSSRVLIVLSSLFWTIAVILSAVSRTYWQFLLCRSFMGAFQAGFTTIAPAVISDLVMGRARSKALAAFNVAIPLGAGIGYMSASRLADMLGNWQLGLLFTPVFTVACAICLCFTTFPTRGAKEATIQGKEISQITSYKEDLVYLLHNKSFILGTFGLTCVTFITGALSWWVPKCMYYGFKLVKNSPKVVLSDVMLKFGIITVCTGIIGACSGTLLSLCLRPKFEWIDPFICGVGCTIALPLLGGALFVAPYGELITFILIFFGQWTMNFIWPIVADILLYVVIPTRRSSALAVQIFIMHLLGDLSSPYIVGFLSEHFKTVDYVILHDKILHREVEFKEEEESYAIFHRLQLSLFSVSFVHIIGIVMFYISCLYIVRSRREAEEY